MKHSLGKGLSSLNKPGPGMTKSVKSANFMRPEGPVQIDAGRVKVGSGKVKLTGGGAPKKIVSSGHKGVHAPIHPEPAVKRDAASVAKPFSSKK